MRRYFLRIGDDSLDDVIECRTLKDARLEYADVALELDRYGQKISASVHIAERADDCAEYPDYILELGPRCGINCQRA